MITDRRPARDKLRREYDSSHRLEKIRVPASGNLAPMFGALEAAREAAAPELMKNVCTRFLASLSAFYGIAAPNLKLLGPRPHSLTKGAWPMNSSATTRSRWQKFDFGRGPQ